RKQDGIAKITVAILASSVKENIRSHRKLGTGTLLNNLAEAEGVATFIVYEDMFISVDSVDGGVPAGGEKIGFLTGPPGISGNLFSITKITRFRDGDIIRHEFNFIAGTNVEFPDKNNIYDINWFIVDNLGSGDLPSENVTTVLDLPDHIDGEGNPVPVANPSIAVAQNNQMVVNEQNVYVAYQAFENNQWRVYLREIVLSPVEEEQGAASPVYISPYLFDENVRQVEIMATSTPLVTTMSEVPSVIFYDESFSGAGLSVGQSIGTTQRWRDVLHGQLPSWEWTENLAPGQTQHPYSTMPFVLCDGQGPPGATGLPTSCSGEGGTVCAIAFNSRLGTDLGDDNSPELRDHTRSFAVSRIPTSIAAEVSYSPVNLSFRMRFHVILNDNSTTGAGITEYPEIWFLIGKSSWRPGVGIRPPIGGA
ncbi:hypothetical protein LCGC14_1900060, partial [marine sediment metagenome]